MTHAFHFFGAGIVSFYEAISIRIQFQAIPSDAVLHAIDATIPLIYQDSVELDGDVLVCNAEWGRAALDEMFPTDKTDDIFPSDEQLELLQHDTETWLNKIHQLTPISAVYRPIDTTAPTPKLSDWHIASLDDIDVWLKTLKKTSPMKQWAKEITLMHTDRGGPLSDEVQKITPRTQLIARNICERDEDAIKCRLLDDFTSKEFDYLTMHTPGGLNDSIFCVAERFITRDDLSDSFWNAIGTATSKKYGDDSSDGERATKLWSQLEGRTEHHYPGPYLHAKKTGKPEDFDAAVALVSPAKVSLLGNKIEPTVPKDRAFIVKLWNTGNPEIRSSGMIFQKVVQSISNVWMFEGNPEWVEALLDDLRDAAPTFGRSTLDHLAYDAFNHMSKGRFAPAIPIFYAIVTHPDLDLGTYNNALYSVIVDNHKQVIDETIVRTLIENCAPYGDKNPGILHNSLCLYAELGEFDKAVTFIRRAADAGYEMDKIKNDTLPTEIFEHPVWKEFFS